MSKFSLYERFINQGTLSEVNGIPNPRFALPSTVNWLHSYAILIRHQQLNFAKASNFYANTQKATMTPHQENSIFEHLLLAVHQLSALQAIKSSDSQADIARVASVAWYYGIYANITAMVAAQDGSLQDNHTKTANSWGRQFAEQKKVPYPFDLGITTLVKRDAESAIDTIRHGPRTNLVNKPTTVEEAHTAICSYLSGTRSWWAWRVEEDLRKSAEFRNLNVSDFRTKAARDLRDARLRKQSISFAHQTIRFRGKANYREALYLAHGNHVEGTISSFVPDMYDVLATFTAVAGAYCFTRLGSHLTQDFLNDIDKYRSFTLDPKDIWT